MDWALLKKHLLLLLFATKENAKHAGFWVQASPQPSKSSPLNLTDSITTSSTAMKPFIGPLYLSRRQKAVVVVELIVVDDIVVVVDVFVTVVLDFELVLVVVSLVVVEVIVVVVVIDVVVKVAELVVLDTLVVELLTEVVELERVVVDDVAVMLVDVSVNVVVVFVMLVVVEVSVTVVVDVDVVLLKLSGFASTVLPSLSSIRSVKALFAMASCTVSAIVGNFTTIFTIMLPHTAVASSTSSSARAPASTMLRTTDTATLSRSTVLQSRSGSTTFTTVGIIVVVVDVIDTVEVVVVNEVLEKVVVEVDTDVVEVDLVVLELVTVVVLDVVAVVVVVVDVHVPST